MSLTSLAHPRKQAQRRRFYPYLVTIKQLSRDPLSNDEASGGYENVTDLVDLPCAYSPAPGGAPETFQIEAPTGDRILLMNSYPQITPGQRAILAMGEAEKWFEIIDVVLVAFGTQTLLVVEPQP